MADVVNDVPNKAVNVRGFLNFDMRRLLDCSFVVIDAKKFFGTQSALFGPGAMQVLPTQLLCRSAAAPTKSVENASGQRAIIIVKMVAARDANDLCFSCEKRACAVVFVGAVETLNHRRVDRHERWLGWQRVLSRGRAKPAGDSDLEIGRRGKSQE